MTNEGAVNAFNPLARILTVSSVLMIAFGVLAIVVPTAAGMGVAIVIGWLIILSGVAHFIYALAAWGVRSFLWHALLGLLNIGIGIYLAFHPLLSLQSLTLILAILLAVAGLLEIMLALSVFKLIGSGWLFLNGIITLMLSIMIWRNWPSSAAWAIGTLVGVNLMFSGFARLSFGARHRAALPTWP